MNTAGEAGEAAWMYIGRDGEPVTLEEKLEQVMQFGDAMERLAIENNARAIAAESRLARAEALAGLAMRAFDYYENLHPFSNEDDEFWEQFETDMQAALAGGDAPGSEETNNAAL